MKKISWLPQKFLLMMMISVPAFVFCQNVGIGLTNPVRARLELNGAVDYTSAIFGGDSSGVSIMRNNPGIGFNDYYNGGHRYISSGYSGAIWLDAINGAMFFDINGYGTVNSLATVGVNSMAIGKTGNVGIRAYPSNASLNVVRGINLDGAAVFGGTTYTSKFASGFNEDTYIRGGKAGSRVVVNDVSGGVTNLGADATNTTEVYGKLYGYGGSPLASTAMNLVPLGVVHYTGQLNNVISGSISTSYENLAGSFVTSSSGYYSNGSTVADYMNVSLPLDINIYNQYSKVIGVNTLNFNGDPGISGGNALITRIYQNVVTGANPYYLIEVGVDDFGNVGAAEVASMSGTVIFYGLR